MRFPPQWSGDFWQQDGDPPVDLLWVENVIEKVRKGTSSVPPRRHPVGVPARLRVICHLVLRCDFLPMFGTCVAALLSCKAAMLCVYSASAVGIAAPPSCSFFSGGVGFGEDPPHVSVQVFLPAGIILEL